jgi:iron(III) transport system substrate-binding protein
MKFSTLLASTLFIFIMPTAGMAAEVNLYTTREKGLIEPLIDSYTAKTGTNINVVYLKDGLAERVEAEGDASPADVLMAVDAGNLIDLVDKGVTQPITSAALESAVPPQFRDAAGNWFAMSMRARVIYAAKDVDVSAMTYEELADAKWQGKLCTRPGQHPYNTALFAAYVHHHGEAAAATWISGLKANLARKAAGGDRDVAKDILGGICQIGIGNSYYVGLMRSGKGGEDQVAWGNAIKVIVPTFKDGGTHVNISGAAIAKHAPNKDEAVKFLEYLVSDEAQKTYAAANFEYPIKSGVDVDPIISSLGQLTPDATPLGEIVKHRKAASALAEKVGYDQ